MGRAGRGGGGGGRSGGGGGGRSGRSFGSSRGGNHRSGFGSGSGGSFGRSGGHNQGGFGGPPPPHHHHHHGPRYYNNRPRRYYGGSGGGSGGGCVTSVMTAIILLIIVIAVLAQTGLFSIFGLGSNSNVTKSTIVREKLDSQYVTETDYYTDKLDWISNSSVLEKGMKKFYKKTGIQPYLYITDEVNGKTVSGGLSDDDMDEFCADQYEELFDDEGHLFVLFVESEGMYKGYYYRGAQIKNIMDNEAGDILIDYIDEYYFSDYNEDEMFSLVFSKTADRMMTKTKSTAFYFIIGMVIIVVVIVIYKIVKNSLKAKRDQQKSVEEVLNKPLDTFGNNSADDLADKYNDN